MLKEEKRLFLITSSIIVILSALSFTYFLTASKVPDISLTGHSIGENVYEAYNQMPMGSKLFLLGQWALIMVILVYAIFKDLGIKNSSDEEKDIEIERVSQNSKTDLDTLYNLLLEKKKLRISTISKVFNVKREVAMEWANILESGGLARIDFPPVGEPVLKAIEE